LIRRSSLHWRFVAWVTGALLAVSAVVFVVVYEQTKSQLRAQVDHDVAGDISELSQEVRTLTQRSPQALLGDVRRYVRAQPFTGTSSLLFATVPGYGTVSARIQSCTAPAGRFQSVMPICAERLRRRS